MQDKVKIDELRGRIDEVLYYLWDPIGVSDTPPARGEYTSYVDTILDSVLSENKQDIVEKLSKIESEFMGLSIRLTKNESIAKRLIEDKQAIVEGFR